MTTHTIVVGDISGGLIDIDGSTTWKGASIVAGDTFTIASGTYAARLRLSNMPDASADPITFINTGGQAIFTGTASNSILLQPGCKGITFRGDGDGGFTYGIVCQNLKMSIEDEAELIDISFIEFDSMPTIGLHFVQNNDSVQDGLYVHNCWFHDITNDEGIYCGPNSASATRYNLNVEIYDNLFEDNGEGIDLNGCQGYFSIRRNEFYRHIPGTVGALNAALAVSSSGAAGINGEIEYNTIDDCDGHGMNFVENDDDGTAIVNIRNNIVLNCGTHATSGKNEGIRVINTGPTVRVFNNLVINTGNGGSGDGIRMNNTRHGAWNNIILDSDGSDVNNTGGATAANNITSDSTGGDATTRTLASILFVDEGAGDYHLQSGSPARDVGTSTNAPLVDYDGVALDSDPDAGPFQYVSGLSTLDEGVLAGGLQQLSGGI